MSRNPFDNKEFKELQSTWYKKLEDTGFVEIEQPDGNLKKWSSYLVSQAYEVRQAKEEYFRAAGKFLYDHKFKDEYERQVWAFHAQGLSLYKTVDALKALGLKAYRSKIQRIVQTLSLEMIAKCQSS